MRSEAGNKPGVISGALSARLRTLSLSWNHEVFQVLVGQGQILEGEWSKKQGQNWKPGVLKVAAMIWANLTRAEARLVVLEMEGRTLIP